MVKAVIMNVNAPLKFIDIPKPKLAPGGVLIKTSYSEVCGTDIHLLKGHLRGVPYPIIPGHVSTGIIEEINGSVYDIDETLLQIGDPVTFLDVHETCNNCWYCLVAKTSTRCPHRKVYGITYSATDGLFGGWSEYIYLLPGVKIIKLSSQNLLKTFMAGGCGLPTAIHAIQRSKMQLGDSVVVQGAGPVGLMIAILAKISGAFQVIMIGGPAHRLQVATDFGVDNIINIVQLSPSERIQEVLTHTNTRGADVTIEATGVPSAIQEGVKMTRDGGTYTIAGQYTDAGDVSINPHADINKKHITIRGSWGSDYSHFFLAVKFIEKSHDKYPWEKIFSNVYSLDDASEALNDVEKLKVMKALIQP